MRRAFAHRNILFQFFRLRIGVSTWHGVLAFYLISTKWHAWVTPKTFVFFPLAVTVIEQVPERAFVIFFWDSTSVHATLSNSRTEHPVARKFLHKFYNCKLLGKGVEFCWVPSSLVPYQIRITEKITWQRMTWITFWDNFFYQKISLNRVHAYVQCYIWQNDKATTTPHEEQS